MTSTMKVEVVSSEKSLYSGEAEMVVAPRRSRRIGHFAASCAAFNRY